MSSDLNSNFDTIFNRLENFATTKTVVGEAISIGDVILLPLVDVSFGMMVGAAEVSNEKAKNTDTGGGGVGAKMSPSAVLVVNDGNVQLVNAKNQDSISKIIDLAPGVISKLNLGSLFGKKDNAPTNEAAEKAAEETI